MDPRRLVGMTQGARQRAARVEVIMAAEAGYDTGWWWRLREGMGGPGDRREALHAFSEANVTDRALVEPDYPEARKRYRVGARLRPCRCAFCKAGYRHTCTFCDGSGVVKKVKG